MSESEKTSTPRAYGWRDFDSEIVEGLVENDSRFINRRTGGWIVSPLLGSYDDKLAWRDDNFKKGSVPAGDPPVSFRAAPTYVLERPLDNAIAGRELIAEGLARWGMPDAARFGNENSELALTWNVFRTLQEVGRLGAVIRALTGFDPATEPDLFYGGRRITLETADAWEELSTTLARLEPGVTPLVTPDVSLHVPGFGWILIEASFGPSSDAFDDPAGIEEFLGRYASACTGLFDVERIRSTRLRDVPPLLLRTIAIAHSLRAGGRAVVVALVRETETADVERRVDRCLAGSADVEFHRVTWESLYRSLDADDPALEPLRRYLEDKSFGLRPAFALLDDRDQTA